MKILIIGAHPHYAAQYCAGTVYRHVQRGDEVYVSSLTGGEMMTNMMRPEELKQINKTDMETACRLLGIKELVIHDITDTCVQNNLETRLMVNDDIRRVRPDIVITHWPNDTHPDLRETANAVVDACFMAQLTTGVWSEKYPAHTVQHAYAFEAPKLSVDFVPDTFVDITEYKALKLQALEVFKVHYDAIFGGDMDQWCEEVLGSNRRWGAESGCLYAEPYRKLRIAELHMKAQKYLP